MKYPILITNANEPDKPIFLEADVGEPIFQCFIPGEPPTITASNEQMPIILPGKFGGRPRVMIVQSKVGKKMKKFLTEYFMANKTCETPLAGPMIMFLTYVFPHKASCPKRDKQKLLPYLNTPDCDNISKHCQDALTEAKVIKDDLYLTTTEPTRLRGPEAYVGISVLLAPLSIPQ